MRAGTQLGPYIIASTLGSGGMGEVYRARDPRLDRDVAIKILPQHLAADSVALQRFEREAKALAALSHPNILTVYDIGNEQGTFFVVTELLEGATLREKIGRSGLSLHETIEIFLQASEGLTAAHSKGIIHRDLKPENIFITKGGRVRLLDFGLAKTTRPEVLSAPEHLETEPQVTKAGTILGTVNYMSPEQVRGEPLDSRSDLFSLGCVLYECLTGKPAFFGNNIPSILYHITMTDPPSVSTIRQDLPESLDRVVKKALAKDKNQRYTSADNFAEALRTLQPTIHMSAAHSHRPLFRSLAWMLPLLIVLVSAGTFLWFNKHKPIGNLRIESIAVLPLVNLSGDASQEYFADGMTEELITDLAKIKALKVISRTSVMQYKNAKKATPQIAKELKVDAILEGSVVRSGNRVRITAQLIQGATDQHLWAESYERNLEDILGLQSEVAGAIARQIQVAITPEESKRLLQTKPVDPEVHELYLKGRYFYNKGTQKDLWAAIDYFQRALGKDPSFAQAYAGIADSYAAFSDMYSSPKETMPKAKEAAMKALALDDSLSEAHASLAFVLFNYEWNWASADKEFRRAIELNPGNALAQSLYGIFLTLTGRFAEALQVFKKSIDLAPLDYFIATNYGNYYYITRNYPEAIRIYNGALEIEPNYPMALSQLALTYALNKDFAKAIAAGEKAIQLDDSPMYVVETGYAYAAAGKREDARKVLAQLQEVSKSKYVCPFEVATIYVSLGETDTAFEWLHKAVEDQSICTVWLRDPRMDPIRSDTRFQKILEDLKFP